METIPRSDRIKKKRKRNTSNAFLEQCYDKKKPISVIKITSTTTIDKSVSSIFNNNKNNINEKKFPNKILLSGQKGSGKCTMAYHLINFILSIRLARDVACLAFESHIAKLER